MAESESNAYSPTKFVEAAEKGPRYVKAFFKESGYTMTPELARIIDEEMYYTNADGEETLHPDIDLDRLHTDTIGTLKSDKPKGFPNLMTFIMGNEEQKAQAFSDFKQWASGIMSFIFGLPGMIGGMAGNALSSIPVIGPLLGGLGPMIEGVKNMPIVSQTLDFIGFGKNDEQQAEAEGGTTGIAETYLPPVGERSVLNTQDTTNATVNTSSVGTDETTENSEGIGPVNPEFANAVGEPDIQNAALTGLASGGIFGAVANVGFTLLNSDNVTKQEETISVSEQTTTSGPTAEDRQLSLARDLFAQYGDALETAKPMMDLQGIDFSSPESAVQSLQDPTKFEEFESLIGMAHATGQIDDAAKTTIAEHLSSFEALETERKASVTQIAPVAKPQDPDLTN